MVLMRSRAITPDYLIDIKRIPDLDRIEYDDDGHLKIGALSSLRAVELSDDIRKLHPILHETTSQMANVQVRDMGTVAGNICRASPSADTACALLALEAEVDIIGIEGNRTVPIEEFFTGPGETVLDDSEMVVSIKVPKLERNASSAFLKAGRVTADIAKVNVASVVTRKNGSCVGAGIALGGVAPTPMRARKAEAFIEGRELSDTIMKETAEIAASETSCITDVRSTEEYRREIGKILVERALKLCGERTAYV